MRNRAVRLSVVLLLAAVGAGASMHGWYAYRDDGAATSRLDELGARIDRLLITLSEAGASQAGYLVVGQDPAAALERFPLLLRQASAATAEIAAAVHSTDASRALETFADATSTLAQADASARDHLLLGDTLTAAHIIFGECREALARMQYALTSARSAEVAARQEERAVIGRRAWMVAAGAGLVWAIGLLLLVRLPSPPAPSAVDRSLSLNAPPEPPSVSLSSPVDLTAAAGLCTDFARVDTASGLAALLDRARSLLDAAGIIVWMGTGDELVAVAAHGYDEGTLGRLRPIRRDEAHAPAVAWRGGELQVVRGDDTTLGAIAAPLLGPAACHGVFTVELRNGRERDPSIRAVVVMIAAQLASAVAGLPATAGSSRATGT
jgi:CHASE3 domain sensor protein